jgi:hypothetical protein
VNPVTDPLFIRKFGSVGNRTRDLWICRQGLLTPRAQRRSQITLTGVMIISKKSLKYCQNVTHRHEIGRFCRKNGANRLARCGVTTKPSICIKKKKYNKTRYTCKILLNSQSSFGDETCGQANRYTLLITSSFCIPCSFLPLQRDGVFRRVHTTHNANKLGTYSRDRIRNLV